MAEKRRARIVVGVDGSAPALGAVEWAAREAALRGCSVLLLAVVPGDTDQDSDEGAWNRAHEVLGTAERVLHDFAPHVEVRGELRHGGVAEQLVSESAAAHLLVVGARGLDESGARLELGSTAETAIALAACPVAVVREPRGPERGGGIVVGVDAAGVADPALDWALHEAGLRGVPLLAVHTWREVAAEDWNELSPDTPATERDRDAHRLLAERLAGSAERFPEVEVHRSVEHDRPVRALLAHAARAELLVIGSRGRTGMTGMLLGSTSRALAHCAPCPLLVVRPRS